MAKKAKRDFDLDAVLSAIEIINGADLLEDPIMVDEDDADQTVLNFIDAINSLDDSDIKSLPTSKDIIELFNEGLPARFFPEDESGTADADDSDGVEPEDDPEEADEVEPEEKPKAKKEEKKDTKKEKEFVPECPKFGEYAEDDEECKTCEEDYPDEFKMCVKQVKESAKKEKPKKAKKEEPEADPEDDDSIEPEEKPKAKKGKKEEKPAKKEKAKKADPEPEDESDGEEEAEEKPKPSFRTSDKPKAKKEAKEEAEEKPSRRKATSSLTGRKIADYFRRVSLGGIVNECIVKSAKNGLTVTFANEAGNIFAQVVSNFHIPFIGKFALGDLSKVIKFASSVGDSEIEVEVTQDRFIMSSFSNKVKLLLSTPETIQTAPDDDLDIEEIVDAMTCSSVVPLETGKDIIFDVKLIKSDRMFVTFEDNLLWIVGGDNATDRFKIQLKKPEVTDTAVDRDFQINSNNFAAIMGIAAIVDEPMELLFSCDEEAPIVIRQGNDVYALSIDNETAE